MKTQIELVSTSMAILACSAVAGVLSKSAFGFLFSIPLLVGLHISITYARIHSRFNESKFIQIMLLHLKTSEVLLYTILIFNVLLAFLINIPALYSRFPIETITNISDNKHARATSFASISLNLLTSILAFKLKQRLLRQLSNHYLTSDIRVFKNIKTSKAALRQNLVKISADHFNQYRYLEVAQPCLICAHVLGLGQYMYRLKCEHVFHSRCFSQYINAPFHNTCPECQIQI